MKRLYLLIFLFISAVSLNAQEPRGYYDGITDQTGDDLKAALHDIVKGHTVKSYDYMWTAYGTTDLDANSKIWDIYSNYRYTLETNQCGTYKKEGDCYNREHLWAQSWTNNDNTEKTDLHKGGYIAHTDGMSTHHHIRFVQQTSHLENKELPSLFWPWLRLGIAGKM